MTFGLIIFHLFLLLLARSDARHKNYGGKPARDGQFPYTASLTYRFASCGASIIHERWALTAAHCLRHDLGKPLLRVGTVRKYGSDGKAYEVEKLYVHPDYKHIPEEENDGMEYIVNDIGLIHLTSNITFNDKVQPIGLAKDERNSYENSTATLAGWGRFKYSEQAKKHLQYINVRVLTPKDCRRVWTYADKHICTSNQEHQGLCYGDSGSALIVDGVQIGVASTADTYCESLKPDLYTKVASFVPWIKDVMSQYGDVLPDS